MRSWKTTVCGSLGALCIALSVISEMPPLYAKMLSVLGPFFTSFGLMFGRDNNVTSEQVGATKPEQKETTP